MANEIAKALLAQEMESLPIPGTFTPQQPNISFGERMRGFSHAVSGDLQDAASSVASALMAPGNALRGEYNDVEIMPDGSVAPFSGPLMEASANMAGLVSLGAMPIPRPRNSLGMASRVEDYGMSHRPPTPDYGARMSNLRSAYGDDIYSRNAMDYYGTGDAVSDRESLTAIMRSKDNPDATVTVYRAIPKNLDADINPGDWVTTSKTYADVHGDAVLDGNYKIIEMKVPARQLTNAGDSIHEWGWFPD